MSTNFARSPDAETIPLVPGDLAPSLTTDSCLTLAALPLGAHLILRCRKDWRDATVIAISLDRITLSVGAPSGRTYRVRRLPDSPLIFEGAIPILGEGASWRSGFARYDVRW